VRIGRLAPVVGIVAAVVAGAIGAALLVMALGGEDEEQAPPAHAPSASPAATATPLAPTPAPPTPAVTLPACSVADFEATLNLAREGDDVRIQLELAGNAPCQLEGTLRIQTLLPISDPSPELPPFANTVRSYPLRLRFPFEGGVGEWTWRNWCGEYVDVPWVVNIRELQSQLVIEGPEAEDGSQHPTCVEPAQPTELREAAISEALGGPTPPARCAAGVAQWLCEFAARLEQEVHAGRIDELVRAGQPTFFTCGAGVLPGYEYSSLCEGAGEGDVRQGFPLALHGSEGGPVTPAFLMSRLEDALGGGGCEEDEECVSAASVGFLAEGGTPEPFLFEHETEPSVFVVAMATGGQPAAVYLAYLVRPGREPVLVAAGLSGDNTQVILRGGVTNSVVGEVEFVALR
jgi:hypothetical protein